MYGVVLLRVLSVGLSGVGSLCCTAWRFAGDVLGLTAVPMRPKYVSVAVPCSSCSNLHGRLPGQPQCCGCDGLLKCMSSANGLRHVPGLTVGCLRGAAWMFVRCVARRLSRCGLLGLCKL